MWQCVNTFYNSVFFKAIYNNKIFIRFGFYNIQIDGGDHECYQPPP